MDSMQNCKRGIREIFDSTAPERVDEQTAILCRTGNCRHITLEKLISYYKWMRNHCQYGDDYAAVRTTLVTLLGEEFIKEQEAYSDEY